MSEEWKIEYEECSEDRRHLTDVAWQIPTTIFIVSGTLLNLAIGYLRPPISGILILFVACFSLILFLNLWKFAIRSENIRKLLEDIEKQHKFRRFTDKERPPASWYLGPWMRLLLIVFIIFLFIVGILNLVPNP